MPERPKPGSPSSSSTCPTPPRSTRPACSTLTAPRPTWPRSRQGGRKTRKPTSTRSGNWYTQLEGPSRKLLVRHRPVRARPPEPRDVRSEVAHSRFGRGRSLGHHPRHRCRDVQRVPGRPARRDHHADHGRAHVVPVAADRAAGAEQPRPQRREHRRHHWNRVRGARLPSHAQRDPVSKVPRVRRERPLARRADGLHHVPGDSAERRACPRCGGVGPVQLRHPAGCIAGIPRPRRTTAVTGLGADDQREPAVHRRGAVGCNRARRWLWPHWSSASISLPTASGRPASCP